MFDGQASKVVQIKKYPNRRYYDQTNSRHITLHEVHDLVIAGHDVCVTESRNGDDITNLVLTQILLERDEPKLDLFPSSMLHMLVRSNRQTLRASMDRLFGPFLGLLSTSQKQFDAYLRQATVGTVLSPMDWAERMMQAFSPGKPSAASAPAASPSQPPPDAASVDGPEPLDELRRQLADLQRRVEGFSSAQPGE